MVSSHPADPQPATFASPFFSPNSRRHCKRRQRPVRSPAPPFDEQDLGEITDPNYPGERLIVCKNPLLADERARKRGELLDATEVLLTKIHTATQRAHRPLRGRDTIGILVGKVLNRYTVGKHFEIAITDDTLTVTRCQARLAPLLFQDEHRAEAEATRPAVVAPAPRSERATAKDRTKRTGDGHTVQSFRDLLRDLATVARNRIQPKAPQAPAFDVMTTPTALQTRAFRLLNVAPVKL